jgi:hypothetical protein
VTRTCTVCKTVHPATDEFFHRQKNGRYGLAARCKDCHNVAARGYSKTRPAVRRAIRLRYLAKNPEQRAASLARLNAVSALKRQDPGHRDRCNVNLKRYRERHRERLLVRWRAEAQRRLATPEGHLNNRLRTAIRYSLRSPTGRLGRSWRTVVEFTLDEVRAHLERQFTDGMTWEAFFEGRIHIDHIRPVSSFSFSSPDDPGFKECWKLANLQPLWAIDNLRKNNRSGLEITSKAVGLA